MKDASAAPVTLPPLTARQAEVLAFIGEVIATELRPPTVREIMARFDLGSTNAVTGHLDALRKKGYLEETSGFTARGILPTGLSLAVGPAVRGHVGRLLGGKG